MKDRMRYPYECPNCQHDFEVIKSVREIDSPEHCPKCEQIATRYIAQSQYFYGASDWDTAHYNPCLGKSFKSHKDATKYARKMGFDEIGNENVEKIHKKYDADRERSQQAKWDKGWDLSIDVNTRSDS